MAKLVLVRHGESEWNALSLWTGWTDVGLSPKGVEEAKKAAEVLKDIPLHIAFTSDLKRAIDTLEIIKKELNLSELPTTKAPELKEKSYGDLTGKNKWKIKEEYGEEQFLKWRRSWDYPVPNGETLKNVYDRVIPYYEKNILPLLAQEKNVIISAHGNSLRALIKQLEHVSDDEIPKLEFGTGSVYVYELGKDGNVLNKEIRAIQESK